MSDTLSENKVKRIARQTGVPVSSVRAVLEAKANYAFGTVARAWEGANMAIYTPDGWKVINSVDFTTRSDPFIPLKGWEIVYNPDEFTHQSSMGKGNGQGELIP